MATSISDRFHARLRAEPGGCVVWTGARCRDGYGNIRVGHGTQRRMVGAHRVSWELHVGPIPEGKHVLHRCDNPPCVRPEHLFLGTHRDNFLDAAAKGRLGKARGEDHGRSRLHNADVARMRCLAATRGLSCRSLSRRFGVSKSTVARILKGESWKSVA